MATYHPLPSFASPINVVNYGNQLKDLNKQLIADIDHCLDLEGKEKVDGAGAGDQQQTVLGLEKDYESFKILSHIIQPAVHRAMMDYGYNPEYLDNHTKIFNFWGNRAYSGGWSRPHWHGHGYTLWTGVYYPAGFNDPNDDLDKFDINDYVRRWADADAMTGYLIIEDPALFVKAQVAAGNTKWHSRPDHFSLRKFVRPRESLLVLFPAWQNHYVAPTDRKRYSISFAVNKEN